MLKPAFTIAVLASLLITSCGGDKKEEKKEENKKEESSEGNTAKTTPAKANMLADISISGMVSEINCTASLKNVLSAMVGVTEIKIDFHSDRSVNMAHVKYDNSLVNDEQMVIAIEKINDGSFKVENIEVKKIEEKTIASKKKNDEKEISVSFQSSGSSPGFALPSILDVFDVL